MENEPMISVIMLTYNREQLLEGMIECIQNQTFPDFEFIIVDNGSSDKSGEIAEEYAKNDDKIKVLHLAKSSIGKGRNEGLKAATGRYIAFVDDDDSCKENFLSVLYKNLCSEDADVAICGAADKNFPVRENYDAVEALKVLLDRKYYNVAFPTKLIKKSLFEGNMFNEASKYDDIYLMPKILACAKKVVYEGKPLYEFRRHENNNSSWTTNFRLLTKETLSEYLEVYRERTEWLSKRFPTEVLDWLYYEWSFWISMVDKITRFEITDCSEICEELKRKLQPVAADFLNHPKTQDFEKEYMRKYIG